MADRQRAHVLIACDKFKGSLTAPQVIDAIRAGLLDADPDRPVESIIVADGGDGTLDAAESAGFDRVPVTVSGPTGEPRETSYARRGAVAVVEMADACGLVHLPGGVLAPMTASSRGLGEVIAVALDAGAREIVVGVGGSASTDGGAGMLSALGARFLTAASDPVADGGLALDTLDRVDLSALHPALRESSITLASDVDNPLLGERGAVAIFAEQKGADRAQRVELEVALTRYARLVTEVVGRDAVAHPGAGAAGGVGFGALAVLGATMRPGIEILLELLESDDLFAGAGLVVTGEGSLDAQTLLGKTPAGVASAAARFGVPVVAVCGRSLLDEQDVRASGIDAVYALTDLEPDPVVCMRDAGPLLRRLAAQVGADHP